jgi:hypothetical protein
MAATGKVIGTVTAVVGEAKATAADGTVRILQVGDQVHSDEVISTSAAGSINVVLANGKTLDCGGDADLALHQGILDVAVTSAPSADVDAIQRAIAAGQDPSQVAAATAAGGAPAAGGDVEGGAHSAVIIEQSNSASVVSSGFATEGDSITFETQVPQALPGTIVALSSAPVFVSADNETAPLPPAFDNSVPASIAVAVELPQAAAPVETPVTVVVETGAPQETQNAQAPVVVAQPSEPSNEQPVTDAPIVVAQPNEPTGEQPTSDAPIVVAQPNEPTSEQPASDEPIVVAQPNEPTDEQPTSDEPIVVAQPNEPTDEQPGDEPVVVVVDETPPVTVVETPSEVPATTIPGTVSLTYSISANTNQDEQLGQLIFENGDNQFQTLVFFSQEGQQKPTAVSLNFDLTEETSTVKLQYVDAFAGNSDSNTGHTATKIAIKDFGLGIDNVPTVLAQENDGVNVGIGSKSLHTEGSVSVDMATGQAGDWSFSNPSESNGIDILDLTGTSLHVGDIAQGTEVINLMGSAAQELTLNAADVLNLSDGANVLHIVGGKEDSLNLDNSWTVQDGDSSVAGAQPSYFGWVQINHTDGATLLVDPDVQIKGALMG